MIAKLNLKEHLKLVRIFLNNTFIIKI